MARNPSDDPGRPSKREMPSQQDIGRRTRSHARTLSGRIYLSGDAVRIVRNTPDAETLHQCLTGKNVPFSISQLTPAMLGFDGTDIIPLNRGGLESRARSIQRWRYWIEQQTARRITPARRQELSEEWRELESLGARVAGLYRMMDASGDAISPFWLEPGLQESLSERIRHHLAGLQLPEEVTDLARLVCWIAGIQAADRFVESVQGGLITSDQLQQRHNVHRFLTFLQEFGKRRHSAEAELEERERAELEELHKYLKKTDTFVRLRQALSAMSNAVRNRFGNDFPEIDAAIDFPALARICLKLARERTRSGSTESAVAETADNAEAVRIFIDLVLETNSRINRIQSAALDRKANFQAAFRATIREEGMFRRLRELFVTVPALAKAPDLIFLPSRDSEIDLDLTIRRTQKVLEAMPRPPKGETLRWLALFCLTDNSTTGIPWDAFATACEKSRYRIEQFWVRRSEPGFSLVLENLRDLHPQCDLESASHFMATGGSVEDLNWLAEQDPYWITPESHGAAAKPFRAVVTWLRSHDAPLTDDQIENFWESIATVPGTIVVESLNRFLTGLSRPSRQQVSEIASLSKILSHPSLRISLIDRLRSWSDPPARPRLPVDCPEILREELAPEVRRLAFYQRLAGQKARIPGSIRGILEAHSRQAAELDHLIRLGDRALAAQKMRLAHLSKRIRDSVEMESPTQSRLLRQLHEVTAVTAMAAVKNIIRDEIQSWWLNRFEVEPNLKDFRWQDLFEIVRWADRLQERSRSAIIAIMRAHQEFGPAWRRALSHNEAWMQRSGQSIEIEKWLNPPTVKCEIDGQQILIRPAAHPIDVFLMGSRFETCLSLHDGSNAFSVIANAADANKNVIYAFRADGTPVARKLVGVASDWKLLGYRLYAHEPSDALERAFARYCGIWAARAGLGLANSGIQPVLCGESWYDDGAVAWSDEACSAYREIRPETVIELEKSQHGSIKDWHHVLMKIRKNDHDALAAVDEMQQTWRAPAAYWRFVSGASPRLMIGEVIQWYSMDAYRDFFHHVTAAGKVQGIADPRRLGVSPEQLSDFWSETTWAILAIVPADRIALTAAVDFLMRIPANREEVQDSHCFATCRISPSIAALPFGRIVSMLNRYSNFFGSLDCGCQAEGWKIWPKVLRLAWIRQPDSAAFAQAIETAGPAAFEVLREFCRICPDWRFAGPIRRKLRTTSEKTSRADLQEFRSALLNGLSANSAIEHEVRSEALAFDPDSPFEVRRDSFIELFARSEKTDAIAATLLCIQWSHTERATLPIESRKAFAREMAAQGPYEEWKTWPLLHWLATIPESDQFEILLQANRSISKYVEMPDGQSFGQLPGHLNSTAWSVVIRALENADDHLRIAAETVFRATVRRKPEFLDDLLNFAAPWIWPETYERLRDMLHSDAKMKSTAD